MLFRNLGFCRADPYAWRSRKKPGSTACARMTEGKARRKSKKEQQERTERKTGQEQLTPRGVGLPGGPVLAFLSVIPDIFNRESRVLFRGPVRFPLCHSRHFLGNPGFCSGRTRTHGGAEKTLDPRVREDDRRKSKKEKQERTERKTGQEQLTPRGVGLPGGPVRFPLCHSRHFQSGIQGSVPGGPVRMEEQKKRLDPRVREDDRRKSKKEQQEGTVKKEQKERQDRNLTPRGVGLPGGPVRFPLCHSRHVCNQVSIGIQGSVPGGPVRMEEQKKTWIPACARMTEGKARRKRKKDRRGTSYAPRRWAAGRDRRIFSRVSRASRPELASRPLERLWSA